MSDNLKKQWFIEANWVLCEKKLNSEELWCFCHARKKKTGKIRWNQKDSSNFLNCCSDRTHGCVVELSRHPKTSCYLKKTQQQRFGWSGFCGRCSSLSTDYQSGTEKKKTQTIWIMRLSGRMRRRMSCLLRELNWKGGSWGIPEPDLGRHSIEICLQQHVDAVGSAVRALFIFESGEALVKAVTFVVGSDSG